MSQADLRALIERASTEAETNFKFKAIVPGGLAIRKDGSQFPFHLTGAKAKALEAIQTTFAQQNVVRYVLTARATMTAGSSGPDPHVHRTEIILFTAEDDSGVMVGHRSVAKTELGALEIAERRLEYEGQLVGLLPR